MSSLCLNFGIMKISKDNLTVSIVTLKSEIVVNKCIESIDKSIPIIVVENSKNKDFQSKIEKKYQNVKCILTNENLGMGKGNNVGIREAKTRFVLVLNPDTILYDDALKNLFEISENLNFTILAPISDDINFLNYKKTNRTNSKDGNLIQAQYVDGYAFILDKEKFGENYFDENFFMYLENNDLCKRVYDKKEKIYVYSKAKIKHLGAKSVVVENIDELEMSRNWHWMWSKFYFNRKHKNFLIALIVLTPSLFSSLFKIIIFTFLLNKKKRRPYIFRLSGLINSILGKKSWYRPSLD